MRINLSRKTLYPLVKTKYNPFSSYKENRAQEN